MSPIAAKCGRSSRTRGEYIEPLGMTTSKKMKVAVVIHHRIEPAGVIDELLEARGTPARTVRLDEANELPPWAREAALILMGGPMSANDERPYPWLRAEKALIRDAIAAGRPVLGICLGAQLIASGLGAQIFPSVRETGWRTLIGLPGQPLFPRAFPAFELHGETFNLPAGARLLATGEAVPCQAFACGSALGLQFHLEAEPPMIAAWTADLPGTERDRCAAETEQYFPEARRLCGRVLDHVLRT